jgi:hypothetical protein
MLVETQHGRQQMTVDDFAANHVDLIASIRNWDLEASLSLCAGLMLCPKMHAYTYGLEILIHSICVHAVGSVHPGTAEVAQILEDLFEFLVESDELPRDVFVVNVMTEAGNRRFLTGTWETPEFWVQHAIDSLSLAPRTERFDGLREQVHALLLFSEAAMERNGLQRYTGSLVQPQPRVKWLTENAEALRRKLQLRDGFRICQLLVTETLVPMAFVKGLPIPLETIVSASQLPATIVSSMRFL